MRLLVIDDDPEIREVLAEFVSASGHQVSTASSGREAIVLLADEPFDAALVDWQMAGISGRDVIVHIGEHYPEMVVFVSTGFDEQAVSDRQLRDLVHGVFRKPYRLADMVRTVRAAVEGARSTGS